MIALSALGGRGGKSERSLGANQEPRLRVKLWRAKMVAGNSRRVVRPEVRAETSFLEKEKKANLRFLGNQKLLLNSQRR